MLYLVQKPRPKGLGLPYTVHGFRSSFRDWAAEETDFPAEVVEMALAHAIRNKAEAAYRRGALIEKRRQLMDAWAEYLLGKHAGGAPAEGAQDPPLDVPMPGVIEPAAHQPTNGLDMRPNLGAYYPHGRPNGPPQTG